MVAAAQGGKNDEYHIAVCDPLIVLSNNGKYDNVRLIANMINRIALWGVYSSTSSARGIKNLRIEIDRYGAPTAARVRDLAPDLLVSYCDAGETNKVIMSHYLGNVKFNRNTTGVFGEEEFSALSKNVSKTLVLTNQPWVASLMSQREEKALRYQRWFPPVPFPFTSVFGTEEQTRGMPDGTTDDWKSHPISCFVPMIVIGSSIAVQLKQPTASYLAKSTKALRQFGCPSLDESEVSMMLGVALTRLHDDDVYSWNLMHSWMHWRSASDFANADVGELTRQWGLRKRTKLVQELMTNDGKATFVEQVPTVVNGFRQRHA